MFFRQIATTEAALSYFFGCATAGKAVAVDVVAGDEERFIDEATKAKVGIAYVIDTHLHADHYSGAANWHSLLAHRTASTKAIGAAWSSTFFR